VDDRGVPYREFRRSLSPRYGRIWLQIAGGYGALAAILAALVLWADPSAAGVAWGVLGALAIGYVLAFLNNFFHEATHYNLLADRRRNDLAANALMGWLFGSSIEGYRRIHHQHHRALGTTDDSENSYFDALRIGYLVSNLAGLKLLRTLRHRRALDQRARPPGHSRVVWLAITAVANLTLAAALWLIGGEVAAAAWLLGLLVAFPFFVSLRQLLEHRSEDADSTIDYSVVDHGAVNRLFGDGPLASTLGSAGFNRHALHHWEPTISYTRLPDIEAYLLRTPIAPAVRARQTTYWDTFLRLLEP
jgi:fatty acid desaturase